MWNLFENDYFFSILKIIRVNIVFKNQHKKKIVEMSVCYENRKTKIV